MTKVDDSEVGEDFHCIVDGFTLKIPFGWSPKHAISPVKILKLDTDDENDVTMVVWWPCGPVVGIKNSSECINLLLEREIHGIDDRLILVEHINSEKYFILTALGHLRIFDHQGRCTYRCRVRSVEDFSLKISTASISLVSIATNENSKSFVPSWSISKVLGNDVSLLKSQKSLVWVALENGDVLCVDLSSALCNTNAVSHSPLIYGPFCIRPEPSDLFVAPSLICHFSFSEYDVLLMGCKNRLDLMLLDVSDFYTLDDSNDEPLVLTLVQTAKFESELLYPFELYGGGNFIGILCSKQVFFLELKPDIKEDMIEWKLVGKASDDLLFKNVISHTPTTLNVACANNEVRSYPVFRFEKPSMQDSMNIEIKRILGGVEKSQTDDLVISIDKTKLESKMGIQVIPEKIDEDGLEGFAKKIECWNETVAVPLDSLSKSINHRASVAGEIMPFQLEWARKVVHRTQLALEKFENFNLEYDKFENHRRAYSDLLERQELLVGRVQSTIESIEAKIIDILAVPKVGEDLDLSSKEIDHRDDSDACEVPSNSNVSVESILGRIQDRLKSITI